MQTAPTSLSPIRFGAIIRFPINGRPDGKNDSIQARVAFAEKNEGYLVMDSPGMLSAKPGLMDELFLTGQEAIEFRTFVAQTLRDNGLDPEKPITGGIDFSRFVRLAATWYGPGRIGPSYEFGRDQDLNKAKRIMNTLDEKLGQMIAKCGMIKDFELPAQPSQNP